MNRLFRKYHRWLAIAFSIPLLTTTISGIFFTIAVDWFHQRQFARFLMGIHTGKILGLGEIFPVIIGIGSMGLLVTGIYMTSLFRERRYSVPKPKKDY